MYWISALHKAFCISVFSPGDRKSGMFIHEMPREYLLWRVSSMNHNSLLMEAGGAQRERIGWTNLLTLELIEQNESCTEMKRDCKAKGKGMPDENRESRWDGAEKRPLRGEMDRKEIQTHGIRHLLTGSHHLQQWTIWVLQWRNSMWPKSFFFCASVYTCIPYWLAETILYVIPCHAFPRIDSLPNSAQTSILIHT